MLIYFRSSIFSLSSLPTVCLRSSEEKLSRNIELTTLRLNITKSRIGSLATVLGCVLVLPSPPDISGGCSLELYSVGNYNLPENQTADETDKVGKKI